MTMPRSLERRGAFVLAIAIVIGAITKAHAQTPDEAKPPDPLLEKAKAAVGKKLKDPYSAKFEELRKTQGAV